MRDFTNDEEVGVSIASGGFLQTTLSFDNGKTPAIILSPKYADGYVHWILMPDGSKARAVCAGGLEGEGFVPTACLLCKFVASQYKDAKALKDKQREAEADAMRKKGNDNRAKYAAFFVLVKGEFVVVRDETTKKKKKVPDFEDGEVGLYGMSYKQFSGLVACKKDDNYEYVTCGADLINRVLVFDKSKKGRSTYTTISITPSKMALKFKCEKSIIEGLIEEGKLQVEVSEEEIKKLYKFLASDMTEDEFAEYQDESAVEKEEEKEEKTVEPATKEDEAALDDNTDNFDFDEDEEVG